MYSVLGTVLVQISGLFIISLFSVSVFVSGSVNITQVLFTDQPALNECISATANPK